MDVAPWCYKSDWIGLDLRVRVWVKYRAPFGTFSATRPSDHSRAILAFFKSWFRFDQKHAKSSSSSSVDPLFKICRLNRRMLWTQMVAHHTHTHTHAHIPTSQVHMCPHTHTLTLHLHIYIAHIWTSAHTYLQPNVGSVSETGQTGQKRHSWSPPL